MDHQRDYNRRIDENAEYAGRTEQMENREAAMLYEQFLDARYVREKREILQKMHRLGYLTEKMIDDFAVTLDVIVPGAKDAEDRYYDLLRCLDSMARFETTGLR